MRKIFYAFVFSILLICASAIAFADVAIDETHFPDYMFREYLKTLDKDKDGVFSNEEITEIKSINCSGQTIITLEGIEYFSLLTYLDCSGNYIKSLDLSQNTELISLECGSEHTINLNLTNNPKLEVLNCSGSSLAVLDLTNCSNLKS